MRCTLPPHCAAFETKGQVSTKTTSQQSSCIFWSKFFNFVLVINTSTSLLLRLNSFMTTARSENLCFARITSTLKPRFCSVNSTSHWKKDHSVKTMALGPCFLQIWYKRWTKKQTLAASANVTCANSSRFPGGRASSLFAPVANTLSLRYQICISRASAPNSASPWKRPLHENSRSREVSRGKFVNLDVSKKDFWWRFLKKLSSWI